MSDFTWPMLLLDRRILSPLANRIYHTLVRQSRLPNPLIAYGDLIRTLGPLPPSHADLKANDSRLFEALGEIARACQSNKPSLPVLTSIVVRRTLEGGLGTPGSGYFALVFPQARDETAKLDMWREKVRRVQACTYPDVLTSAEPSPPTRPRRVPAWLREPTVIAACIGLLGTLLTLFVSVWLSVHRDEPVQQRQPGVPAVGVSKKYDEPLRPRQPDRAEEEQASHKLTLDEILDVLQRHHQRASFGAVAGILGRDPRSLFDGYMRTPGTAWVVNKSTGLPTGTKENDYPAGLLQNKHIIDTPDELRLWLRDHH
jgi:hypothetical protein